MGKKYQYHSIDNSKPRAWRWERKNKLESEMLWCLLFGFSYAGYAKGIIRWKIQVHLDNVGILSVMIALHNIVYTKLRLKKKYIVLKRDVNKNSIHNQSYITNYQTKLNKNIKKTNYGSKWLTTQMQSFALVKNVWVELSIYLFNHHNAKNVIGNFVNNAWWTFMKVLVMKISKITLENGKDALNARHLLKKRKDVIIWPAVALINFASYV